MATPYVLAVAPVAEATEKVPTPLAPGARFSEEDEIDPPQLLGMAGVTLNVVTLHPAPSRFITVSEYVTVAPADPVWLAGDMETAGALIQAGTTVYDPEIDA